MRIVARRNSEYPRNRNVDMAMLATNEHRAAGGLFFFHFPFTSPAHAGEVLETKGLESNLVTWNSDL
jgi:hypothetical protein